MDILRFRKYFNYFAKRSEFKFISRGEFDITEAGMKVAFLKILPQNSILLSSRAPIGYRSIARNEVITNQGFKSLIPSKGYSLSFVYYTIKNSINLIENNSAGSTFKEISGSVLKSLPTFLPDKITVKKFASLLNTNFEMQNNLEKQYQHLTSLRDWLLPMLMNGQVTVKEAEKQVDMAAEPEGEYGK